MKNTILLLSFACFLTLGACNTDSQSSDTKSVESTLAEPASPESQEAIQRNIQASPSELLNQLKAKVNGVEATMYNSGASFSVYEPGSIMAFMTLISSTPPLSLSKTQVGHLMFLHDGEMLMLCNVYDNGNDIYMEVKDESNGTSYFNILTGQAKNLFQDIQLQTK